MTTNNPYVGPRPFERKKEDSARFFGRSHETQEIVSLILGHPVTLVYAQSGAGKTSLFNASVAVELEESGFDVLPLTRVGGVIPKDIALDKVRNLYMFNALLQMDPVSDPRTLLTKSLSEFLEMRPRTSDENGQQLPRAVIFDQFEELFTYTPEDWREQRKGFFLQIVEALNADKLLRVVFVIREDYLAELDPYARDLPERLRIRYRLERLREDAALRAIKQPLEKTSRHFAPEVAEKLIEGLLATRVVDATGNANTIKGQYVEPVQLQVVCVTLWDSLAPDVTEIQEEHLKDFDVNSALSDFYTSAIEGAVKETGVKETDIRNLFGRTLITPMETRSTVFRGKESTGGVSNVAMDYLESRHIIRAEFRAGVRWYELTHDRFIEAILVNNKDWFFKRRKAMGNPLTEPAQEWKRLGKDKGSLPRGATLNEMDNWAESNKNELDDLETEFLQASWELYDEELVAKIKSEKRLRALVIGLGAVLIFAVGAALVAVSKSNDAITAQSKAIANAKYAGTQAAIAQTAEANAEKAAEEAEDAKDEANAGKLALQAISSLNTDSMLSLLLAIEANNLHYTTETDNSLRQVLQAPRRQTFSIQSNVDSNVEIQAQAFSLDGQYLVTGDSSGMITLWDVSTGRRLKSWGGELGETNVDKIVFAPDGTNFATGNYSGFITIWPVQPLLEQDSPILPNPLNGLTAEITSLVFSPNGSRVAAADVNGTTLIWDISKDDPVPLKDYSAAVKALAFSPSGDRILTGSSDNQAIVWDSFTGEKLFTLSGYTESVSAVSFSPDGNYIVTAGDDVRVWDSATGKELGKLIGHEGTIISLDFEPVNGLLATEETDNTVRLWNIADAINGGEATTLTIIQPENQLTSFSFSPDGQFIVTTTTDGKVRLWGVPDGRLQMVFEGHTESVIASAFNVDGTLLATTSWDNTVRIWGIQAANAQKVLTGSNGTIWEIKFNPEGTLLASKGENSTSLWNFEASLDSENSENGRIDIDGAGIGFGIDFNSDGTLLATTSADQNGDKQGSTVRVFDVKDPFPKKPIWSHPFEDEVAVNLAFNVKENLLAINTDSNTEDTSVGKIHLWDIVNDREKVTLTAPSAYPIGLAFSPDGTLLAASGYNSNTILLWKVNDILDEKKDTQPIGLFSDGGAVLLAFDPTGTLLVTGGSEGTINIWKVAKIIDNGDKTEYMTLSGHEGYVVGLAFSKDGLFASSDENGNIGVWDVNKVNSGDGSEAGLLFLQAKGGAAHDVTFSPDGKLLLSSGDNGEIILWTLSIGDLITMGCNRLTRNLTQTEWVNYFGKNKEYHRTCDNLPYHDTALVAKVEKGEMEEVLDILGKTEQFYPNSNPEAELARLLIELGSQYINNGKHIQALEVLNKAIDFDPTSANAEVAKMFVEIGHQLANDGYYERALEVISKASEIDPNSVPNPKTELAGYLIDLGYQYLSDNDYDRTLDALNNAIEIDPTLNTDVAGIYVEIGHQLANNGDYDRALEVLRRANDLDPTLNLSPEVEVAVVKARVHVTEGDYDQALELLRQTSELNPSLDFNPSTKMAQLILEEAAQIASTGDYDKIIELLANIASYDPNINYTLSIGMPVKGEFETDRSDLWVFNGTKGQSISIQMIGGFSGLDTYLTLLGPSGDLIANDDFDGTNSQIDYEITETGTYFIVASGFGGQGGAYQLTVTSQ